MRYAPSASLPEAAGAIRSLEPDYGAAMPQMGDADLVGELALARRELAEALERQAATDEVLRLISSSPGELEPVFNTILENATRLCEAKFGVLYLYEGGGLRLVATHNVEAEADISAAKH